LIWIKIAPPLIQIKIAPRAAHGRPLATSKARAALIEVKEQPCGGGDS